MVKLFEFQEKEIRTIQENGKTWFSGQDVFGVLELTWKGASELLSKRQINKDHVIKKGYETSGGKQDLVFISEVALYKIALRAQKSAIADKFVDWVSELLVSINSYVSAKDALGLKHHLKVEVQKSFSKQINSKNYREGGVEQTIDYNVKNCLLHTDKTPKQVIQVGKNNGLKSKDTSSAKQVIRTLDPALACSMSLTDSLVKDGVNHEEAAKISRTSGRVLFEDLMRLSLPKSYFENQN